MQPLMAQEMQYSGCYHNEVDTMAKLMNTLQAFLAALKQTHHTPFKRGLNIRAKANQTRT
jgi:hypothetical protein